LLKRLRYQHFILTRYATLHLLSCGACSPSFSFASPALLHLKTLNQPVNIGGGPAPCPSSTSNTSTKRLKTTDAAAADAAGFRDAKSGIDIKKDSNNSYSGGSKPLPANSWIRSSATDRAFYDGEGRQRHFRGIARVAKAPPWYFPNLLICSDPDNWTVLGSLL